jgi:hypothetical protein
VYHIERGDPLGIESERVGLHELERVSRLAINIDPDHFEPGPGIADGGTTSATKQVEKPRFTHTQTQYREAQTRGVNCTADSERPHQKRGRCSAQPKPSGMIRTG